MPTRVAVIGSSKNEATERVVFEWGADGMNVSLSTAAAAYRDLGPADAAVARLDVVPGLDGVEDGLLALFFLERRGIRVLNPVASLLAAHDKLRTARRLARGGLPHPATVHVTDPEMEVGLEPPLVVKPRYGSWGTDVVFCGDEDAVHRALAGFRERPWFRRHGALVQEALPSPGHDLRVLVAGGLVVGAARRVGAAGEWRTNVSCGGSLQPTVPSAEAAGLAVAAVAAIGGDVMGVDLMPRGDGRYTVLEVNAAVEFDDAYTLNRRDVFEATADALGLLPVATAVLT